MALLNETQCFDLTKTWNHLTKQKLEVGNTVVIDIRKKEICGTQSGVRDEVQLKSRLVRIMGATRVQMYKAKHTQLEVILTHTAGHLLVMV